MNFLCFLEKADRAKSKWKMNTKTKRCEDVHVVLCVEFWCACVGVCETESWTLCVQ